jgi:hypothetical protein
MPRIRIKYSNVVTGKKFILLSYLDVIIVALLLAWTADGKEADEEASHDLKLNSYQGNSGKKL